MMLNTIFKRSATAQFAAARPAAQRNFSTAILKEKMEIAVDARRKEVVEFRKEHGNTVVADVTVAQIMGGMRGIPGILYETSKLDA